MKRDKSFISRKIYFYRVNAGYNMAGMPLSYDVKSALDAINKLNFQPNARYLNDKDGFEIGCWIDEASSPQKVRFYKIKRDDLPQVEHKGNLTDLQIPEDYGLAECVHVMFFPENIVGLEYNYYGARITNISEYLDVKTKDVCSQKPEFEQLVQPDVIEKLKRMRIVRKFSLKVREALFSSIKQIDESLAGAFQTARELSQAKQIEITLTADGRKGTLSDKVKDMAKEVILLRDVSNDVISGEIKGLDEFGNIEIIDLLSAKLVAEKWIPRHNTRTNVLQSEQVYMAINDAYNELKDQLLIAAGVTL